MDLFSKCARKTEYYKSGTRRTYLRKGVVYINSDIEALEALSPAPKGTIYPNGIRKTFPLLKLLLLMLRRMLLYSTMRGYEVDSAN